MVIFESKSVRRIALALALCLGGGVFAAQLTSYAQKERTTATQDQSSPARSDKAAPPAGEIQQDSRNIKPNAFSDDGFWTTTGSTGQLDEASVGLADFRNFEVGFRTTPNFSPTTGTIVVRYNITAVTDAIRTGINGAQNIKVRYRDADGTGTGSQVLVTLYRVPVNFSGRDQIAQFNSNLFSGSTVFQTRSFTFCPSPAQSDFDFTNYAYYAEVELSRNNVSMQTNFGGLQISESDSNPCP